MINDLTGCEAAVSVWSRKCRRFWKPPTFCCIRIRPVSVEKNNLPASTLTAASQPVRSRKDVISN